MNAITYKVCIDNKGTTRGVELWQDGQHITISLEIPGQTPSGYKWTEVKASIDKIAEDVKAQVMRSLVGYEELLTEAGANAK